MFLQSPRVGPGHWTIQLSQEKGQRVSIPGRKPSFIMASPVNDYLEQTDNNLQQFLLIFLSALS